MAKKYCMKCAKKREMVGAHAVKTKNGRNALEGTCTVCGSKMFSFTK